MLLNPGSSAERVEAQMTMSSCSPITISTMCRRHGVPLDEVPRSGNQLHIRPEQRNQNLPPSRHHIQAKNKRNSCYCLKETPAKCRLHLCRMRPHSIITNKAITNTPRPAKRKETSFLCPFPLLLSQRAYRPPFPGNLLFLVRRT